MTISSMGNNALLQSLLASSMLGGSSSNAANTLQSLLGSTDSADSADISSQGQSLSALSSLLPADLQDKAGVLQDDLNSADPSNLSDDDLKAFLSQLKSDLGALPGSLASLDPENLTTYDLTNARNALVAMKSAASTLGQAGSALTYAGVPAAQQASLAAMLQAVSSMGGASGSGELSLLSGFNPLGDGSENDSSDLYSALANYSKSSLLGTGLMSKLLSSQQAGLSGSGAAGSGAGLDGADMSALLSTYLSGSGSLSSLLSSYAKSGEGTDTQSSVDYSV